MTSFERMVLTLSNKSQVHLGFDLSLFPQKSPEWHKARLGMITGSKAHSLIASGRSKGSRSAKWDSYMLQLITEVATAEGEEIRSKHLDWGNEYESLARDMFIFETNEDVKEITFVYGEDIRSGCSPDGLTSKGIIEIKCPSNPVNHIEFALDKNCLSADYLSQMQFNMRLTKTDVCTFISFDPRNKSIPIVYHDFEINKEDQKKFDDCIPEFIEEMDIKLNELGITFGSQWRE